MFTAHVLLDIHFAAGTWHGPLLDPLLRIGKIGRFPQQAIEIVTAYTIVPRHSAHTTHLEAAFVAPDLSFAAREDLAARASRPQTPHEARLSAQSVEQEISVVSVLAKCC